eukprot:2380401-Amphidinium_carterae.1
MNDFQPQLKFNHARLDPPLEVSYSLRQQSTSCNVPFLGGLRHAAIAVSKMSSAKKAGFAMRRCLLNCVRERPQLISACLDGLGSAECTGPSEHDIDYIRKSLGDLLTEKGFSPSLVSTADAADSNVAVR